MLSRLRPWWLLALVVGGLLGLFSFLGDGRIGSRALGLLANLASPWAVAAFFVGRVAGSPKRGAAAGALTLISGVASYYLLGVAAGYSVGAGNLVWITVALVAGPVMGLCGAVVRTGDGWGLQAAVAAPSVMLLAEAIFVFFERRAWLWDLDREPHRISDVWVLAALTLAAALMPAVLGRRRIRSGVVYSLIVVAGSIGATALGLLYRVLVGSTRLT